MLFNDVGETYFSTVATSAFGPLMQVGKGYDKIDVYVKEQWCIGSTSKALYEAFEPFKDVADASEDDFVECRGKATKLSAIYPTGMAHLIWNVIADKEWANIQTPKYN